MLLHRNWRGVGAGSPRDGAAHGGTLIRPGSRDLKLGAGDVFRGEGILAITKALLQSGVSYVGGYQGSPISHLMDVLADAKDVLDELGVHFETSASEATAAATLSASVMYPIRGAVTWKSTAGTNVAADALSNLSSGGVTGGALIIIGEDYGEGSSIMQERSHAYAMKSQIWLLDPRPNLPTLVRMVEKGVRAIGGVQHAGDAGGAHPHLPRPRAVRRQGQREAEVHLARRARKSGARRRPHRAAARFVRAREGEDWSGAGRRRSNSSSRASSTRSSGRRSGDVGVIMLGGMYNTTMRALQYLGLADAYGEAAVPLYVLNVAYPLIEEEVDRISASASARC